jgi:hypothetical protein
VVEKHGEKQRSLGRPRRRREDNIKMEEGMNSFSQDKDQWWVHLIMVIKSGVFIAVTMKIALLYDVTSC